MNNYLKLKIFERYFLNLIGSLLMFIFSFILVKESMFWKVIFGITIIYFLLYVYIFIGKILYLKKVVDNKKGKEYKTIDNSVFTEDEIVSFSYDKIIEMKYRDILSVQHGENSWENVWRVHKYKGNHKISIQGKDEIITILVRNEEIATKIISFIKTKNNHCKLYNMNQIIEDITLNDLDNWQINNRFGDLE